MVQYRRNRLPGGTFFFTATLQDRSATLLVDHIDSLRDAFRLTRRERPFTIDAIVVLPDHFHVIWTQPEGDADFSGRWRRLKSAFTRQVVANGQTIARNARGEHALWQRRFWEHTVRDDADFERCVDYIHFNPVKHRVVRRPIDWPHSSLHRFVRNGVLPADGGADVGVPDGAFGERSN